MNAKPEFHLSKECELCDLVFKDRIVKQVACNTVEMSSNTKTSSGSYRKKSKCFDSIRRSPWLQRTRFADL